MLIDSLASIALNLAYWSGVHAALPRPVSRDWIEAALRTATVGFAAIIVFLELLGAVGWIGPRSVSAMCIAVGLTGGAVGLRRRRQRVRRSDASPPPPTITAWAAAARIAAGLAAWAAVVYLLIGIVFPVEPNSDAPIYHLPFALQWLRSGSLDLVPTPFGNGAATYYPANGDLWLAWLMATGSNSSLVKVAQWPWMVIGALALFGIGRHSGAKPSAAVFAPVLWMTLPLTLTQSGVANVDLIWCAFYLVALYFALPGLQDRSAISRSLLYFCGLASGIVCGAKTVGALYVLLLIVPIAIGLARQPRALVRLVSLAVCVLIPSAFWYARNVWLTGNPLYPVHVSLFGHVIADGWFAPEAMKASAYHLPVGDWRALVLRLQVIAGFTGVLLVSAGIASGWILGRRSPNAAARRALLTCSALAVAHIAIYWFLVPFNTQERFILSALGMALIPLATIATMWPAIQWLLCAALAWQLLAVTRGPAGEWFTVVRLFDNPLSRGNPWVALSLPAAIAAAAAMLRQPRRLAVIGAVSIVAIGAYASARPALAVLAEQPLWRFYPRAGFAARMFPAWEILERHSPPEGANVAYTGTNLPLYLRAIDFRNDVRYVNINRHEEWLSHDYHRALMREGPVRLADNPFPEWHRAGADFAAWLANLRRRDIQFVFIARENRHGRRDPYPAGLPEFPIEKRWADAHPELFDPLGPVDRAHTIPWASVYRLRPRSTD